MNEIDRYLFDVNGYIVLENVLDDALLEDLNKAVDANQDRVSELDIDLARGASAFVGDHKRNDFDDALAWPAPWSAPFRKLLTLPVVMRYMLEFLGDGFRCDTVKGTVMNKGTQGFSLHGGSGKPDSLTYYKVVRDKIRNGLMNVSYALTDVNPGDGGFVCMPGSHKATFQCPAELCRLEQGGEHVKHLSMKAGSAVIFTEALMHGTLPWVAEHERRTLFIRYSPGALSFRRESVPAGFDQFEAELTPLQRAVLEPPYYQQRPSIAALLDAESH